MIHHKLTIIIIESKLSNHAKYIRFNRKIKNNSEKQKDNLNWKEFLVDEKIGWYNKEENQIREMN